MSVDETIKWPRTSLRDDKRLSADKKSLNECQKKKKKHHVRGVRVKSSISLISLDFLAYFF